MRRCEYCGHENDDQRVTCVGCGTKFLVPTAALRLYEPSPFTYRQRFLMIGGVYPPNFERRPPVCGIVAVSAPLVGLLAAWVVAADTDDSEGASFFAFIGVLFLVLLVGGVSAFLGLLRGEKCRPLDYAGVLANFGPILLWFLAVWLGK